MFTIHLEEVVYFLGTIIERLRRENQRLKRQLEERDMLCELLKKVRELEGM